MASTDICSASSKGANVPSYRTFCLKPPLFYQCVSWGNVGSSLRASDWETVEKGDYQDPFQLDIDPVAEYNTQFFPRLCLEETPSVDMSGHDYGKEPDGEQNALNNDEIYNAAQAEFARELESFEWTCQYTYDLDENEQVADAEVADAAPDAMEQDEPELARPASIVRPTSVMSGAPSIVTSLPSAVSTTPSSTDDIPTIPSEPADSVMESLKDPEPELDREGAASPVSSKPPSVRTTASAKVSSRAPSIILPLVDDQPEAIAAPAVVNDIPDTTKPPALLPMSPSEGKVPPNLTVRLPSGPPSSGLSVSDVIAIGSTSQGSPNLLIRRHRQLPSIDKYPHARLSVELNGTFGALGDEDWEQLDAEAIPEMINGANAKGQSSAPNSFFARLRPRTTSRILSRTGRNASIRVPSGLRKAVTSDSDTSSERSPSKAARQPLFASRGIENTKKAFTRIKAFPPAKRNERNVSGGGVSGASSTSPSPVASIRGLGLPNSRSMTTGMRDTLQVDHATVRRGGSIKASGKRGSSRSAADLPSLFSRPKVRRAKMDDNSTGSGGGSTSTSVSASPSLVTLDEPIVLQVPSVAVNPAVPRVELTTTAPIVWELSLEGK